MKNLMQRREKCYASVLAAGVVEERQTAKGEIAAPDEPLMRIKKKKYLDCVEIQRQSKGGTTIHLGSSTAKALAFEVKKFLEMFKFFKLLSILNVKNFDKRSQEKSYLLFL